MSNRLDSLTAEELLKALEETKNTETVDVSIISPVLHFLNKLEIKPGSISVRIKLLYTIFNKVNPGVFTQAQFTQQAALFLEITPNGAVFLDTDLLKYSEILKIKKKENVLSMENKQRHIAAFFNKLGITKGNHKLPSLVFFHIYRSYCIDNKKKVLHRKLFFQFMDLHFVKKRGTTCHYYLVDEKTANIYQQKEFDGITKIYSGSSKKEKVKKRTV